MLIGYVSDERYVALADVLVEFERGGESSAVVRSTPNGAVRAPLEAGNHHRPHAASRSSRSAITSSN
jgi:N,N-dimethylformamidase